ncbi:FG-GAP repeat domain-containing protein [Fontivita pretiosa]|uniref:FG-GAP repeat domain-containing protein n=1 Tax=Fontivita pretiosa TaxID=2989684 RepID=UPI003D16B9AA
MRNGRFFSFASRVAVVACGWLLVGGCESANNQPRPTGKPIGDVWTQDSFEDFSQGRFGDGGVNTYVSAAGRIQLINRWDLNGDGNIDLVFANSHPQAEKLDAVIYWGNGQDFSEKRVTPVPNEGSQHCVAADVNGDGSMDLVVANYANGTWSKMPSAVYYGAAAGTAAHNNGSSSSAAKLPGQPWPNAPFATKIALPTEAAQSAAVGDLNRDGYPDIVFAQSAGFWEYRGGGALASPSRIYWGSASGYSPDRFLDIEASGASDVEIADLNRDGWLDLVIANRENNGKWETNSFVYFGGEGGFSADRRVELPTNQVNAVEVADINGDGAQDILFANGQGGASFIYLNDGGSFSASNRIELPTSDARDVAAGDLNGDGAVDVFFTNHQTAENRLTRSYLYWGSSGGFSPDRRQEFETVGAWGVSLADLNRDGRIDIVVSNFQEHESFDVPSYIYWNSEQGLSDGRRTSLFTRGAVGNTVADFNGDGNLDVLFNNTMGRRRGGVTPSFVYWGDKKGQYSVQRRLELPGVEPYDWAAGDLDDDGKVDLVLANMAEVGRRITESFIYWGQDTDPMYAPEHRSAVVTMGGRGVSLADLDRDGYLDLLFFNTNVSRPGEPGPTPGQLLPHGVFIYWGSPDGFVTTARTELPGSGNGLPQAADLNYDGNLDIIVTGGPGPTLIYWGDGKRDGYSRQRCSQVPNSKGFSNSEVADLNKDGYLDLILVFRGDKPSYVYWGNEKGEFSDQRRTPFTPIESQGVTVGDVNGDGWLDIVAPSYKTGGSRATMSRIFLGGPEGISDSRRFELPTMGGTGSLVSDFNRDGYTDLLLICHRSEGDPNKPGVLSDHCTDSYLYWGGPDGFKVDRKLLIPVEGAHYDAGTDLGNIYDRSLQFDYISPAHEYGGKRGQRIEWKAQTPPGTKVKFQVRTAASQSELAAASWVGPKGQGSYYERSGASLNTPEGHSWIQYRAVLESENGANSPVLDSVSLSFR